MHNIVYFTNQAVSCVSQGVGIKSLTGKFGKMLSIDQEMIFTYIENSIEMAADTSSAFRNGLDKLKIFDRLHEVKMECKAENAH